MLEELIPIVMFVVLLLIVFVIAHYRFRTRREVHLTVRDALDKGVQLPGDFIARLDDTRDPRDADLRRALILLAIALGFVAFALVLGVAEATRPLLGVGMIPMVFGLAYLGLWKFASRPAESKTA